MNWIALFNINISDVQYIDPKILSNLYQSETDFFDHLERWTYYDILTRLSLNSKAKQPFLNAAAQTISRHISFFTSIFILF